MVPEKKYWCKVEGKWIVESDRYQYLRVEKFMYDVFHE